LSLSSVKKRVLETLWTAGKPLHRDKIAAEIGLPARSTMGHLLGLIKAEYVSVAEKNHYEITDLGAEALDVPRLSEEQASSILGSLPAEKAFHFYRGMGQYAGISAKSLDEFCRGILTVDLDAISFHFPRGDFESWFKLLGDAELPRKLSLIRQKELVGEALRQELYEIVKSRRDELAGLSHLSRQLE
jgi:hypothetical protein